MQALRTSPIGALRLKLEETGLVDRALEGDRGAFDQLVRLHLERTFRVALRYLANREDAEDVVQEAFVKAQRHLGSFRRRSAFGTWVTSITLRLCHDRERARRRRRGTADGLPEQADHLAAPDASPLQRLEDRETLQMTRAAVADLPPRLRSALILRVLEGRDSAEVAEIMGTSPRSIHIYVSEARRALGHLVERRMKEPGS